MLRDRALKITRVLANLLKPFIQTYVVHLVLVHESLEIIVDLMQEHVDLIDLGGRRVVNLFHLGGDHICKFLLLQLALLQYQVDLIKHHFADFDHLLMSEHEILVHCCHAEI